MKYQICTYYSCFWTLLDAWKQEALYRYVSRVYAETVALMQSNMAIDKNQVG